ncbi:MAG: NAD(P)-dependent oxidoreductase [Pseudomonadota bacterium]|nr:NAD(P)-dependent oxidoreductase [Pseudomonadota bacterium]
MRVAVTGATGFVGGHIASALRTAGVDVRGVVRRPDAGGWLVDAGVTFARADLADVAGLADAFAGADAVVANAALGSYQGGLEDFVRTNVAGTENTLRAAAAAGVRRVVYISTVALYDTVLRRPMTEDHPRYGPHRRRFSWTHLGTDWRYCVSKQAAEERAWALAAELGLSLTALRPGPIYGSRDPKWTARLLRTVARPVAFAPTVGIPAVHAGDVASAVVAALDAPAAVGRAYNIAGPPTPLADILAVLARLRGGARLLRVPVPVWVAYDTGAARTDLGFTARPLEEGLAEAVSGLVPSG